MSWIQNGRSRRRLRELQRQSEADQREIAILRDRLASSEARERQATIPPPLAPNSTRGVWPFANERRLRSAVSSLRVMSIGVKICGLNQKSAVEAAVAGGADYLGFVFFPRSPRYVDLATAASLASLVPSGVLRVGLVVDAETDFLNNSGDDRAAGHVAATRRRIAFSGRRDSRELRAAGDQGDIRWRRGGLRRGLRSMRRSPIGCFSMLAHRPAPLGRGATRVASTGDCWAAAVFGCHGCSPAVLMPVT